MDFISKVGASTPSNTCNVIYRYIVFMVIRFTSWTLAPVKMKSHVFVCRGRRRRSNKARLMMIYIRILFDSTTKIGPCHTRPRFINDRCRGVPVELWTSRFLHFDTTVDLWTSHEYADAHAACPSRSLGAQTIFWIAGDPAWAEEQK